LSERKYLIKEIYPSTSRALSTETISFSVSVKLVKKLPNKDTSGAA